jgi:uncharacterized protein (TIGR00251 family)
MPCIIAVHVTPRASRPGIGGWKAGASGREELEVRVSAPPADGQANEALVRLLSKRLGIPKSSINIVAGDTGRHKRIALPLEEDELRRRLVESGG